jgi:hypothetical protein
MKKSYEKPTLTRRATLSDVTANGAAGSVIAINGN